MSTELVNNITIPKEYAWVLLSVVWIGLQVVVTGFINAGPARKKWFTKDFLNKHFGEEHKKLTGSEFPRGGGYPDIGSGMYAQKLSYEGWMEFNVAQRIHANYVENVASIIVLTLVAGVFHPCCASVSGFAFIFGRVLYQLGYYKKGGAYNVIREAGAVLCALTMLSNFIMANCGIFGVLKLCNH